MWEIMQFSQHPLQQQQQFPHNGVWTQHPLPKKKKRYAIIQYLFSDSVQRKKLKCLRLKREKQLCPAAKHVFSGDRPYVNWPT